MKRSLKQSLCLALCMVLLLSMLPVTVFGESLPGEPMTVKVVPPASWGKCYVYSWGPDQFGGWPGQEMTMAADGSYSFTLTEAMSGILLSNGMGEMTEDITNLAYTSGSSATITIGELGSNYKNPYTITYCTGNQSGSTGPSGEWPVDGDPDTNTLFAWVPDSWNSTVNAYTWSPEAFGTWPGASMTAQGEWYRITLPSGTENIIINDRYYKSRDLFIEPDRDVYLVLQTAPELHNWNAEIYYGSQNDQPEAPATRTLRVQAPENWDTVYAYSWNPGIFGTYPGAIMMMSNGWYAATIPGDMENLILSDYANGRKTDDLYLEPDEDVWIVVREDCSATISYVEPAPEQTGLDLRVVGDASWMGNWSCDSTLGQMHHVSGGDYQVTFQNVLPGDYQFKVLKDGKWDGAVGEADCSNYSFTVTRECSVTVTYSFTQNWFEGTAQVTYDPKYMGDVSGDKRLNVGDVARLYGHIKRTTPITDEMALLSGDFMGDGRINVGDTARIYSYIKASSPTEQVQAAYQLRPGQLIPQAVTLTGTVVSIPEPYSEQTGCITLNIAVDGCESMPLLCSRIRGEGVENILVGSRITVEGTLQNFYGSIEFEAGCQLVSHT